ncbi:MAG: insulinase family protein, partial [Gammaproteobacteria bacterium]|nr:insulinase family protein [Gammaproteobacteria bacterium]
MKSINLKYIVMALLVIINTTAFGKPMLDIQRWSTKNGARVLFTEAHELPMVDIIVIFYAGSIWNGKNFGLASFTGSMLSEGTKTLTADQIADNFDQIGAQFSVGVDVDVATVSLRCLTDPDILNKSLKTFSSVLTEPSFPENEFKRVQKQILIRILQQKQEPGSVAYSEFLKSLYGDFPYGASFDQKQDVISKLTPVDLQNFYNKYYV